MVSFFIDFDSAIKCKLYAYKFLTRFREASYYRIFFQHSELSRTQIITCKDAEGLWNNQIRCFNQCICSRAVVFNVFMLIQKNTCRPPKNSLCIWHPRKPIVLTRRIEKYFKCYINLIQFILTKVLWSRYLLLLNSF